MMSNLRMVRSPIDERLHQKKAPRVRRQSKIPFENEGYLSWILNGPSIWLVASLVIRML